MLIYNDSGDTINGKTARSGLPIVTEEMVTIKIEDNNKNTLSLVRRKIMNFMSKSNTFIEDTRSETI